MDDAITGLDATELASLFRPKIVAVINEIKTPAAIEAMEELVQLTPPGLFEMMRIKGLRGKKLAVLWKKAKTDTVEGLLQACKENKLTKIPGFGMKTEQNIVGAIEALNSSAKHFHYADVADIAVQLAAALQQQFKDDLISLCGEVRRQATTVETIELVTTVTSKKLAAIKRLLVIASADDEVTYAHTLDEIPVTVYHTIQADFYRELFVRTGNVAHVAKILKANSSFKSEEAVYKRQSCPLSHLNCAKTSRNGSGRNTRVHC